MRMTVQQNIMARLIDIEKHDTTILCQNCVLSNRKTKQNLKGVNSPGPRVLQFAGLHYLPVVKLSLSFKVIQYNVGHFIATFVYNFCHLRNVTDTLSARVVT